VNLSKNQFMRYAIGKQKGNSKLEQRELRLHAALAIISVETVPLTKELFLLATTGLCFPVAMLGTGC
jgi:hypothetical protein